MRYLVLAMETAEDFAARDDPERAPEYWSAWSGYLADLQEAGVLAGAGGLEPPPDTTVVSVRDGRTHVQDGPYADTKEQLGGYFVLELPDREAALEWARRCPSAATGSVHVRPQLPMPV